MRRSALGQAVLCLSLPLAILACPTARLLAAEGPAFLLVTAAGKPVSGARVLVLGGNRAPVLTDAHGRFRLEPEPAPPFELAVFDARGAWLGLVAVRDVASDQARRLTLPPTAREEVTVRGAIPIVTDSAPAAATAEVSRREIESHQAVRLADTLAEVPGASSTGEGHTGVPSLRGLARGRTLVLLDGARVTTERRAGASATFLDPAGLESVEIVRGPGSVAYGSDALGGVIHASSPLPRPGVFSGKSSLSAGSADESLAGFVEANVPVGSGALLLQVHQRSFDDYRSPAGRVENSSARDRGFLARALVPVGGARLILGWQVDEGRALERPASDSFLTATSYPRDDSSRLSLGLHLPPSAGFSELTLRAFYGASRVVTDRDRRPMPSVNRRLSRSDVDARDASFRLVGERPLGTGTLRLGIDGKARFGLKARGLTADFDSAGVETGRVEEVSIDSARRLDTGLFVEGDHAVLRDRVKLAAGLRGDWIGTRNSGGFFGERSTAEEALSGYAAATLSAGARTSVTLQYSRGFRDPSLSDRYFRGVSGRGFVTGNPDLRSETSDQYDLAIRTYPAPSARLAVYGYLYRVHDLVERYSVGQSFAFRNRGTEELRGAEIEADLDFAARWSARLTLSAARGRILDDGSFPADVPASSASLTLDHRPGERFWWNARLLLVAGDDEPGPTETETPGYGVLDVSAGLRLTPNLEVRLTLHNLTDRLYPESADAAAVPARGRGARVALGGKF